MPAGLADDTRLQLQKQGNGAISSAIATTISTELGVSIYIIGGPSFILKRRKFQAKVIHLAHPDL